MQPEDIKITANIPFLKARTALLVEDPNNPISVPRPDFWEEVHYRFEEFGLNFLFIPELLAGITPMIADYLFPGYDTPNAEATYQLIRDRAGIGERPGLLYKKGGATWFKDLSVPGASLSDAVWAILDELRERSQTRFSKKQGSTTMFSFEMDKRKIDIPEPSYHELREPDSEIMFSVTRDYQEELDERTIYILSDVQRFLKEHNLTLDELRVIIGYRVKLSRMAITRTGKIYLKDFPDKYTGKPKEIKMDSLTKMLYFFYLKHPEGVRVKEVDNYIDELMHIYMGITGRDDKDAIRASIQGHVAPYNNSINVSMSRIKSAFKNQVDESVAKFYWVEGVSGEPYRVALDRDYVIWEY